MKSTLNTDKAERLCLRTSERLRNICLREGYHRQKKITDELRQTRLVLADTLERNESISRQDVFRHLERQFTATSQECMQRKKRKLSALLRDSPLRQTEDASGSAITTKSNIVNLSSHQLSRSEEDTLNLIGLSFCPRQRLD